MKKLLNIFVIALLSFGLVTDVFVQTVFAEAPASDNYLILGSGGANGLTPTTVVVPVRYGRRGGGEINTLASGTVVSWDEISADGFTISACNFEDSPGYAGVLVTAIQTADSSTFARNTRNWGYMAIHGYALASVDTSQADPGEGLYPAGGVASAGGTPNGSFRTQGQITTTANIIASRDIGVLLRNTGTDGLMPVWLK